MADQYGLDLVLVSESPAVAKLINYGKWQFEEKKKAHAKENDPEVKRKQAYTDMKEITLSYKIAEHDFQVCVAKARRFLDKGHRVRCSIRLKGRETRHHLLASGVLTRLAQVTGAPQTMEQPVRVEGNKVVMVLAP